jgi:CubicO group peptidase (beta-lactamase class C family)
MNLALRFAIMATVGIISACRTAATQTATLSSRPSQQAVAARVDSLVQDFLTKSGVASASVALVRGDEVMVRRAWGTADLAEKRPARPETVYRIASVSKQFTAALVLRQVDKGKLAITDSIARFVPGLPQEWRAVTIEQLLNHTSGLPREFRFGKSARPADAMAPDSLLAIAARGQTEFAPGTKWAYSNVGYLLLGLLVERLYEKPFAAALRDEIAKPLRLLTLGWCDSVQARSQSAATGYERSPEGSLVPAVYLHPSQSLGSGGVCASASDMAAWNRALHRGRVLSAASYAAMTTPRGAAASNAYGFGLRTTKLGGHVILGHTGGTPGFVAENVYVPAESLSVTVLYNAPVRASGAPLFIAITREALGIAPSPPGAAPLPAQRPPRTGGDSLAAYVGEYRLSDTRSIVITLEDGVLSGQPTGQQKLPLTLRSGTTFVVGGNESDITVRFITSPDGRVTGMAMRQSGSERTLPKVR